MFRAFPMVNRPMQRRSFLSSVAALTALGLTPPLRAETVSGELPWKPGTQDLPVPVKKGGLAFFTEQEAATMGAIAERMIPADELSIGAKEAGCVTFIDRQLAGDFGKAATQYRAGPIVPGTPEQGPQEIQTPAERYRTGLASLDKHCQTTLGKAFIDLTEDQQDQVITELETGKVRVEKSTPQALFALMLMNVREGFLSDPMYGGNKGMAGWKMIGFPGARYDFRDVVDKRGQKLNIIPTSMIDNSL